MSSMKTILSATAVSALMVTGALADCPGAGQTFTDGVTLNPNLQFHPNGGLSDNRGDNITGTGGADQSDFDSGSRTDADCFTAAAVNTASGVAVSGIIVESENDPDVGIYQAPQARAYGPGSTAIGANAQVLKEETYIDGGADGVGDDPATLADESENDVEATRRVPISNGTALGANSLVSHDGSTAVGAGATTKKANEVVLGTEKTVVRAPNIPANHIANPTGLVVHDGDGNLGTDGGSTFRTINAHSALLSDHTARLDEQAKGLAIAMAMPDAWLSDKKRFGIFGAVGGFEGETALGFAAIGRLDETWSLNAKVGADTEFDHVGWQVGVGAQW